MQTVRSRDGTLIGFERSGTGAPLVLVHGTAADHSRWNLLLPAFEPHFTVFAVDRRGRGGSGDSPDYSIEREFEDIVAVLDAIGKPSDLLGHSYGGICALEAARQSSWVRQLVLYEPPIPTGPTQASLSDAIATMEYLLDREDREGLLTFFLQEIARLSPNEIAQLRTLPSWAGRVAAAHTIPGELESQSAKYQFEPNAFDTFTAPTLLLVGGDSSRLYAETTTLLKTTLANSHTVVLEGQQHVAMNTAPELFVQKVMEFLRPVH